MAVTDTLKSIAEISGVKFTDADGLIAALDYRAKAAAMVATGVDTLKRDLETLRDDMLRVIHEGDRLKTRATLQRAVHVLAEVLGVLDVALEGPPARADVSENLL